MHDIEPFYFWRDFYVAAEDQASPFYGKENDLFVFRNKVYNYVIHPQWDEFGSAGLYLKVLYADYHVQTAVIEFIGEWDDCLQNDVMFLKRNVIDPMVDAGIRHFILIAENVLNFHAGDDDYYQEWAGDIEDGWIVMLNPHQHVEDEMREANLHHFVKMGEDFSDFNWRRHTPAQLARRIQSLMNEPQYLP